MSSGVFGLSDELSRRAEAQRVELTERLAAAKRAGRTEMTPDERRAWTDMQALQERAAFACEEAGRAGINNPTLARIRKATTMTSSPHARVTGEPRTYRAHGRESWIADMVSVQLNRDDTGQARDRLSRHAQDVTNDLEYRDLSRIDGQGGYAVPPAWLMDQYVELARPGRAFANLAPVQPLPGGTDNISIPKLLTGTTTGIQVADNTAISETDITDTFINAPVRTIAGQQSVALQLLDQSPIAFDEVIFRDLAADHATQTDTQVIRGTGVSGQVLGVDGTPNVQTVALSAISIQGIYSGIANAIQKVHVTRFLPPDVIVMHPRRWSYLLALLDTNSRPLFVPQANSPFNATGILSRVDSQQIVGQMHGLPVVTDPNVTVTHGAGTGVGNEDVIYVLRSSDLLLFESGVRSRVLPEVKASTLTVVIQLYGYLAFTAARFAQSVVIVEGGLVPPTF